MRWDGGAAEHGEPSASHVSHFILPTPLLPSPVKVVEEVIDGPHDRGRTGFPTYGAGQRWEVKERYVPKEDGSKHPTSNWAPPPLRTSWKGPSSWDTAVPGSPWSLLGGCPAPTLSWRPPALAFELLVEHVADGPDLTGVFLHMRGLLLTASPAQHHPPVLYRITESHGHAS